MLLGNRRSTSRLTTSKCTINSGPSALMVASVVNEIMPRGWDGRSHSVGGQMCEEFLRLIVLSLQRCVIYCPRRTLLLSSSFREYVLFRDNEKWSFERSVPVICICIDLTSPTRSESVVGIVIWVFDIPYDLHPGRGTGEFFCIIVLI